MRHVVGGPLKRLLTDYIELDQTALTNRAVYHFPDNLAFDPRGADKVSIGSHRIEIIELYAESIGHGKTRQIAIINETGWDTSGCLALAKAQDLGAVDLTLSPEIVAEIAAAHRAHPPPC